MYESTWIRWCCFCWTYILLHGHVTLTCESALAIRAWIRTIFVFFFYFLLYFRKRKNHRALNRARRRKKQFEKKKCISRKVARIRDEECNNVQVKYTIEEKSKWAFVVRCACACDSVIRVAQCVRVCARERRECECACVSVCVRAKRRACICAILHRNRSFLTTDADAYFLGYCFIYVIRMRNDCQPKVCMNKTVYRGIENYICPDRFGILCVSISCWCNTRRRIRCVKPKKKTKKTK